jgi:hypothetical protein
MTGWHRFALTLILLLMVPLGLTLPTLWAWVAFMVLLVLFLGIAGMGATGRVWGALIDDRNMMSLSRLQMALWTILVLSAFLAAALANIQVLGPQYALDINVPTELWLLMGISTTSLVASPLIRSTKRSVSPKEEDREQGVKLAAERQNVAVAKVKNRGAEIVNTDPAVARLSNVLLGEEVVNAGRFDLSKVQNLYFTVILIFAYGAVIGSQLSEGGAVTELPALSTGMVTLLAISHAGYLTFKAVPHSPR